MLFESFSNHAGMIAWHDKAKEWHKIFELILYGHKKNADKKKKVFEKKTSPVVSDISGLQYRYSFSLYWNTEWLIYTAI